MRYLFILMFAVLASHVAFGGNDSTETVSGTNRFMLHMTSSTATEPAFASGSSHIALGIEYVHYFHVGEIGGIGIGAKFSRSFIEQYPLNIPTRLEEQWVEIPIILNLSGEGSSGRITGSGVGIYLGCLMSQDIHEQPGSVLPLDVKKDVGFLGYFRVGMLIDYAFPVYELPKGALYIGLNLRGDFATFGEPSNRGLSAKQTAIGVYFGIAL